MGLVREMNATRSRLYPPDVHLEVARGETVKGHRTVIADAVLVELTTDQAFQIGAKDHLKASGNSELSARRNHAPPKSQLSVER